jgi:hypothetical protein
MFIIEQHIDHNIAKNTRKRVFTLGMPLAKRSTVKRKFTYKEFTLVLGVFVALLVAITLWAHSGVDERTTNTLITIPGKIIPTLYSLVSSVLFRF